MAEVKIRDGLWQDFIVVARKQQKTPEALAQRVLREYLQQVADEELLARSEKNARQSRFSIGQTEEVIRKYRRKA